MIRIPCSLGKISSNRILLSKNLLCFDAKIMNASFFHSCSKILPKPFIFQNKIQNVFTCFRANLADYPKYKFANLPSLSPTMDAGNIAAWVKKEGDKLEEGDTLCQIETDKAVMTMETPFQGYLAKILFPANTKNIAINKPIAVIVKNAADVAAFKDFVLESAAPASPVAASVKTSSVSDAKVEAVESTAHAESNGRISASPLAKKISRENKVDIANIKGSGPGGRILAYDVREKMEHSQKQDQVFKPATVSAPTSAAFSDIEISMMRATIAKRLSLSKQTIPHFHVSMDIHMDECVNLKNAMNSNLNGKMKFSINDFVIKASALALLDVPAVNSHWLGTSIRQFHRADISVAVSTDAGLITPIIFDASSKTVSSISSEMRILAQKAKKNTLQTSEYLGGTFSISSLGMFGVPSFSAIINPPQSCILAVGTTRKMVVVLDDSNTSVIRSIMTVNLGCDHRVVDGVTAASWLVKFKEYLEKPFQLII